MTSIRIQLKKIAKDFSLNYHKKWFIYAGISKKQEILTEFLSPCPDPLYNKYGKTIKERLKNLDKFVSSKDFKECCKRFGGAVCTKKGLQNDKKIIKLISNPLVKKELEALIKIREKYLANYDHVAILTRTNIKKEKEWLFKHILMHEWIHLLLYKNNIKFQKKGARYYAYDEGLCDFFCALATNNLNKLELFEEKETYPLEKSGWTYAIKFRNWLKNCKTSKQRKNKILDIYKKLK